MPRYALLRMAIFTGMRSALAVTAPARSSEATVTVDRPHHALGLADLGADGRGDREAHRAEAAGVHPRVRVVELPALAGPHLVLADTRSDDRVVGRVVAELVDDVLRLQRAVFHLLVVERELLLPVAQLLVPRVERREVVLVLLGAHRLHHLL